VTTAEEIDPTPVQCGVVTGDNSHQTECSEAMVQAYGKVVDLLVGFRRIIRRGAVRLWGEDWFAGGCPASVRDRLIASRDEELEMERFSSDVDDPFELATFGDLAELVESSESLDALLQGLALSPDGLVSNLRTLEDLRQQLAAARVVSDSEAVVLDELHLRMREKLSGVRRQGRGSKAAHRPAAADLDESLPEAVDQSVDPAAGNDHSAGSPTQPPSPATAERTEATAALFEEGKSERSGVSGVARAAAEGFADDDAAQSTDELFDEGAGDPIQSDADERVAATPVVELEGPESTDVLFDEGEGRLEANRIREGVLDGAATPVGLVHVEPEDFQVLRDLRSEIIGAAEAAYQNSPEISTAIWQSVLESGWFSKWAEVYGLAEVATFYAIMEIYLERLKSGDDREALRTYLADCELAKLLLRLRDLFIRLRV